MGISRAYLGFFFPQLDSPESPIHLDNEQKSLIGKLNSEKVNSKTNVSIKF